MQDATTRAADSNAGSERTGYAHRPVPQSATIGVSYIAIIIIGGTIAVPGFLMAAEISKAAGFINAVWGFIIGCAILAALGTLCGLVGVRSRLSTYLVLRQAFGSKGFRVCNLLTASVSLFWYAIIGNLFGDALAEVSKSALGITVDARIFSLFGGLGMTAITLYGITALDKLARIVVPAMVLLLLYGLHKALGNYDHSALFAPSAGLMTISGAASAVIGAYSGGIVTLPDFLRYARSERGAAIAIIFALGISFPIVLTITAIPSILSGQDDLINIMLFLGIGVGALVILLFSTVSSNCLMLYSAGLAIAACSEKVRYWPTVVIIGTAATILSLFDVIALFIPYINLLAILIPALCGIYICDFFLIHRGRYGSDEPAYAYNWPAFVAWGAGALVGLGSLNGHLQIFGVSALDSLLSAALAYWALSRIRAGRVLRRAGASD